MRPRKPSKPKSAKVLAVANQAAMGVALGLVFAMILIWTPSFGVNALIKLSADPTTTMATLVGAIVLMFAVGSALTGFILTMEDTDKRS